MLQVYVDNCILFFAVRSTEKNLALRTGDKRATPKFYSASLVWRVRFMSDTVHRNNRQTVCNCVSTLHRGPCFALSLLFGFGVWTFITYCSRVNQHISPLQRHQSGCFRIPLVPTYKHPETSNWCVDGMEAHVTRCKIKLFIISRVVRYVHFSVFPCNRSITFNHHCRIVVKSCRTSFEQGCNDYDTELFCQVTEKVRWRTWYGFSQIKVTNIFRLTEI